MKILMVLTSYSDSDNKGKKTGLWLDEFASPYYLMTDEGAEIMLASPKGGQPPVDTESETPNAQTVSTIRFHEDENLKKKFSSTISLSAISASDYDAVFYSGGHGALWDFPMDAHSLMILEDCYIRNKPMAFVCYAQAALIHAKTPDGVSLIKGKEITCYSNTEEAANDGEREVPFLLEDELKKQGAHYSKRSNRTSYVKKDGILITGQNHFSSKATAEMLLGLLINR